MAPGFQQVFGYIKRPFDMGFWNWRRKSTPVEEPKKENRVSIVSNQNRNSVLSRGKSFRSNRTSTLSNNPKVPPWEVTFNQHLKQCLRAAKIREFTYFRLSAALGAKPDLEKIDHKATLLSIILNDAPIRQMELLNESRCKLMASGFKEYVSEIEGAKSKQLDWLALGRLLDSEEVRLVELITAKIKETSEAAKDIIKNLPLDAVDNAASVWVECSGFSMGAFRVLCSQTTLVSGRVGEFERGDFRILRQAEDKVKEASDAAILAIFGEGGDITSAQLDYD